MQKSTLKPQFSEEEPPFTPSDRVALAQLIDLVVRPGLLVAEVGSWTGLGSTQTFLSKLAEVPGATLVCVDNWRGGSAEYQREMSERYDIFGTFRANVEASRTQIIPIVADSISAAKLIAENTFDLVFIDADHSFDCIKADIAAWLPKVRPGGILCGHDCESRVTPQDKPLLDSARNRDAIEVSQRHFRHFHAGVILAVDEVFAGSASLFAESPVQLPDGTPGRSTMWHVTRPCSGIFRRLMRFA